MEYIQGWIGKFMERCSNTRIFQQKLNRDNPTGGAITAYDHKTVKKQIRVLFFMENPTLKHWIVLVNVS